MKLSVHLVTWNGERYIRYLFDSLKNQTFRDWKLVVLDNGSQDNTVFNIRKELTDFPFESELIEGSENIGFANGHNLLYKKANSEYFLLLNQDMWLSKDCLEKLVRFLDNNNNTASVSPRLMRWDFDKIENELGFTNHIDSLGLKPMYNKRVTELGAQEEWKDSGETKKEVFGVSGALPMYRKTAIEAVKFSNGSFFDELYHSYKEDVDLAFRLRSAGYDSFVVLDTEAYHDRSGVGLGELGDMVALKNKKGQSEWIKYHSYKNHLMTLYKNEYCQNLLIDFPSILWYELKKFFFFLFFDAKVLRGWKEIWRNRKVLKKKRKEIKEKRKTSWRKMRKWWK